MNCKECKFWTKSKMNGNHCKCLWSTKPCERTRRYKNKTKRNKKKLEKYGKGAKKMRF